MKKIKILSNIPGFTKGDLPIVTTDGKIKIYGHTYNAEKLVERDWAEYVKDDIDIKEIRNKVHKTGFTYDEAKFCEAFFIVKNVIDQLNRDWKPEWENDKQEKYQFTGLFIDNKEFEIKYFTYFKASIIPPCKDKDTALKVIKLAESELKVLFNIN